MVNLTGFKKIDIAVFISGAGSNLLNLIKHSKLKNSKFSIKIVFSNNKKAKGLKYAKKYKIPFKTLNYENKKKAEINSLSELKGKKMLHILEGMFAIAIWDKKKEVLFLHFKTFFSGYGIFSK